MYSKKCGFSSHLQALWFSKTCSHGTWVSNFLTLADSSVCRTLAAFISWPFCTYDFMGSSLHIVGSHLQLMLGSSPHHTGASARRGLPPRGDWKAVGKASRLQSFMDQLWWTVYRAPPGSPGGPCPGAHHGKQLLHIHLCLVFKNSLILFNCI